MNFITEETLNISRQRIKIQDLTKYNMEKSKDSKDILRVEKDNKKIYIGSKYSVSRDIDNFMKELGEINPNTTIIVFGLGATEHLIRLKEILEEGNKVLVVEPDMNIIHKLKNSEKFNIFEDDRFTLCVAKDEHLSEILSKLINGISLRNIKFIIYANYNKIFPEELKRFFNKLNKSFNDALINNNTSKFFSEKFTKCYLNNVSQIIKATPVNRFKNIFKDKPAIVVSAGPSLTKNIHKLKDVQDKFIIITGARSLKALLDNGISPDFICLVDPGDINCGFIKDNLDLKVPMVFHEYSNYNAISIYRGEKIFFTSYFITQNMINRECDNLPAGGSVAHTCTSLAVYMSCSPIIFIGQDFAYTGEKLHADISTHGEKNKVNDNKKYIMVEDVYGDIVKTDPLLNNYRLNMEGIIEFNKDITFINSTEGGANMKNTLVMPLQETIEKYSSEFINKSIVENILNTKENYKEYKLNAISYLNNVIEVIKEVDKKCKKAMDYNNSLYMYYKGIKSVNINNILYELDSIDSFIKENRDNIGMINYLLFEIVEKVLTKPEYMLSSKDSEKEKWSKIFKKSKELYGGIKDKISIFLPLIENAIKELQEENNIY